MSKLGVGIVLAAVLILTSAWAAHADFKVAIVDSMDVVSKSADGKRAQDAIKRKSEELGRPIAQERQDLQKQVEEFQKQAGVMKEDARKQKAEALEKRMRDFEKKQADGEKQMQQFQEQQMTPLLQKLDTVVKAVAQQEKLDLILDKRNSGLLFMDPKMDITDKVRSHYGQ
ncbi:MAG: OmpH family outer membrane protein [Desulfobaccales bacterium]